MQDPSLQAQFTQALREGQASESQKTAFRTLLTRIPRNGYKSQMWNVLHAIANQYPISPTLQKQVAMRNLLEAFAILFPCSECGPHLSQDLGEHPPQTQSREALQKYIIDLHNRVNKRLGYRQLTVEEALLTQQLNNSVDWTGLEKFTRAIAFEERAPPSLATAATANVTMSRVANPPKAVTAQGDEQDIIRIGPLVIHRPTLTNVLFLSGVLLIVGGVSMIMYGTHKKKQS